MQPPPLTNHVTYHGTGMPNVMVTIDADFPHLDAVTPGEYHGTTRMAGQDEHAAWWRLVSWRHRPTEGLPGTYTDWFPAVRVRPAILDDYVGIIPPTVLEQMRAHQ